MTRKQLTSFAAAALMAIGALVVAAPVSAATVPGAPWVEKAPADKVFPPLDSPRARRPELLLETDYYAYGPGVGFTTPVVNLTADARLVTEPLTMYLYWQNRDNGETRYYSLQTGAFGNQERDLFGAPGAPVRVQAPNLTDFQLFGPNGALGPLPASIPSTVGRYQFVFELRDANGNQVISRGNAMYNQVSGVATHSGNVTASETWDSNQLHVLTAPVNVQAPAVLTIEAGAVVLGSSAGQGTLVITQGARIEASGTADLPIIMSSEFEVGERAAGDWGGLVINGFAPTNQQNPMGEGNSGPYGGDNPNDNSGTLRYVRVEFGGILFSDQNELNGIALQGVGRGTTVEHVQIHFGQDDGIEFFGGTVDAKYVLVTGANDDSLDWTFGWTGRLQHFVAIQNVGNEDRGIEADNFESNPSATPRSAPMIANATFISNRDLNPSEPSEVIRLRRGTGGNLTHFIVALGPEEAVRVTEQETLDLLGTGLQFRNSFFVNNATLTDAPAVGTYLNANNEAGNPQLPTNPDSMILPDVAPLAGTVGALPAEFRNDPFFDNVTYAGGVNPNNPWIFEGWTTFSDN